MAGTVLDMPSKPKSDAKGGRKTPKYPSREKLKYVGIPKEYWAIADALTADGEKYEGRSVAFLVKVAVRAWLVAEGVVDEKGKPISPPKA